MTSLTIVCTVKITVLKIFLFFTRHERRALEACLNLNSNTAFSKNYCRKKKAQLRVGESNQERKRYLSVMSNKVRARKQFSSQTDIQWARLLGKIM